MEDSALLPPLMKSKSKFVIGAEPKTVEGMSPPPAGMTCSNNSAAPATNDGGGGRHASMHRHHVKRRSHGHARIPSLAGKYYMNNSSLTDTEADEDEDGGVRLPLRRSQSQRSLRRMDMLQPMMPLKRPKAPAPAALPVLPSSSSLHNTISGGNSRVSSASSFNPSLRLSTTPSAIAEPIEQPLHVVAHNLVVPEIRGGAYSAAQEVVTMSTSPRSTAMTSSPSSAAAAAATCKNAVRSQFIIQRQDPASSPIDLVDREYTFIKECRNPMTESLIRCVLKKRRSAVSRTLSTSAILHTPAPPHQPLAQALRQRRQQQQKPLSSSSFPLFQYQYQYQHQHHTALRLSSSNSVNSSGILGIRWGAAAGSLWERIMHGV